MAKVVLNIAKMRAERSASAPTVIGPDEKEYTVGLVPLDAFLEIIELQERWSSTRSQADESDGTVEIEEGVVILNDLVTRFSSIVTGCIPGFPVGMLTFDELMLLIDVLQIGAAPEVAEGEAGAESEAGESTPPL